MTNNVGALPSSGEVDRLVDQVDRLVLPQANVFLRELLRDLGLRPQPNKAATRVQLVDAITAGVLTEERIDHWLRGVEGWGNQHVYAFGVPESTARAAAWRSDDALESIAEAAFPGSWRASTTGSATGACSTTSSAGAGASVDPPPQPRASTAITRTEESLFIFFLQYHAEARRSMIARA